MNARIVRIAAVAAALCLASLAARADGVDSVAITLSAISGAPGATVDVMGTITNSGADTLSLDGDDLSVSAPLTATAEFLSNAPFTLNGGASATFEFFEITINPGAAPGVYGTDNSDVFSFFGDFNGVPVEDNVNFTVDVTTPEPGTILLLLSGLACVALFRRRSKALHRGPV